MGYLDAWLLSSEGAKKDAHWTPAKLKPSLAERQAARGVLYGMDGAVGLVEEERNPELAEPDEPSTLVGLVSKQLLDTPVG